MIVKKLGIKPFKQIWEYQQSWMNNGLELRRNKKPIPQELLMLEHNPVYTLGKSADPNNMLVNNEFLKKIGAESFQIERGGDITYHGPGQLVVYPLLDLEEYGMGVKKYIHSLEESIINTLKTYEILAGRIEGKTGIWLDGGSSKERKIAAIGIKCSRYLTIHGMALNVNTNMEYFNHIVPCGISESSVTSMQKELGQSVALEKVINSFEKEFKKIFIKRI